MIRKFSENDLNSVMEIWLNANLNAHFFISKEYWKRNFDAVKEMLPQAEIYVYEDEKNASELRLCRSDGELFGRNFCRRKFTLKGHRKDAFRLYKADKI